MTDHTDSRRILITGGCGFIGVNLGRVLVAAGWEPVAYDNLSTGTVADAEAAGFTDVVEADIRDVDALRDAARGARFVVHLAAQAGVPSSLADPLLDCDLNVRGTLHALLAARDAEVSGFVLASSNAPLGDVEPPAHENVVPRPKSPYGASKLAAEAYCSAFAGSWGLHTVALRFANVYGPYSYHKGSVVAHWMKSIMDGGDIVVHGDGSQTRDFVFVEDLARGILQALESGRSGTYHLGTGVETELGALATHIGTLFPGRSVSVVNGPERPGDIHRNCADISSATKAFGYSPSTPLSEGLVRTADWFQVAYNSKD